MTTTYISGPEQSSSYLSHEQIDRALQWLRDNWPHQQLTPAQEDAWLDVLCQLHPGELQTAVRETVGRGHPARFRPDAYPLLEVVIAMRRPARAPFEPEDTSDVSSPATAAEWFAKYRETLRRPA